VSGISTAFNMNGCLVIFLDFQRHFNFGDNADREDVDGLCTHNFKDTVFDSLPSEQLYSAGQFKDI